MDAGALAKNSLNLLAISFGSLLTCPLLVIEQIPDLEAVGLPMAFLIMGNQAL
jgi:hypothetical protein